MTHGIDVVGIVGSLRRQAYSRRLALALASVAPAAMRVELVPIGALALYGQDTEADPPAPWREFRERGSAGGRGSVRHAGIQPLGARSVEERDRRGLAPLRPSTS
jgi:hypothetical protein